MLDVCPFSLVAPCCFPSLVSYYNNIVINISPARLIPPRKGLQKSLTNFFSGFSHQLSRNLVNFLTIWSPSLQTPNKLAAIFCHCCSEESSRQGCQRMKCWRHFVWHLYYSATSSIYRSSAAIGFKRTLRNKRLYEKWLYERHERKLQYEQLQYEKLEYEKYRYEKLLYEKCIRKK